ncbi:MAG: YeeE/YedE family protein [Acidobacteria bacterium]|nr:YeeE/YedE family protein [Acidobacteriota bacterium]
MIQKPYWSPYLAGAGIGLMLVASFYLLGNGLGASGAFSRLAAVGLHMVAPAYTEANGYFRSYFADGRSPLNDWMLYQVAGVFLGGLVGAITTGRFRKVVEKGATFPAKYRFLLAFAGGAATGLAARLARGCTSGQALSGGSELALGSWAFMLSVFAGGYAMAWFVRRQWS